MRKNALKLSLRSGPTAALRRLPAVLTVVAVCGVLAAGRAGELPAPVLPQGMGVNIHFQRGHTRDLDRIAAAGFKFIRMDLGWAGIEQRKGAYDWSSADELMRNLDDRGLRAVLILDYSNPLYESIVTSQNPLNGQEHRDTASPQHPESIDAFARWAAAAVQHFRGRHIIWEIWNEPNISFWKPKPNVEQYSALALATGKAVRQANPEATLVGPASSGIPHDFLEGLFKSGALAYLDAVSVHPYRSYSKPPESAADDYAKIRRWIEPYVPADRKEMPILSGEWGYSSFDKGVSLETQAAYAVRQQLANLLAGVPLSIWYDWQNDGPNPSEREDNFGIVQQDLAPKPAYTALQTLARELGGFKIDHRLKTDSERDYLLLCSNAAGAQKIAAWTLSASQSVTLYLTDSVHPIQVVSGTGQVAPAKLAPHGLVLDLGQMPIYVTIAPGQIRE